MKILKTILIILGIALTSITFGQLLSQNEGDILFYTLAYNSDNNRLEHRLDEYPERHVHGDQFYAPLTARTYFRTMEIEIAVESWMTNPFKNNYYEMEPFIESWMTAPFKSNYEEEEVFIESWMTVPFDLDKEVEVETWMTTSWM